MKKLIQISLICLLSMVFVGCTQEYVETEVGSVAQEALDTLSQFEPHDNDDKDLIIIASDEDIIESQTLDIASYDEKIEIPEYNGEAYVILNNNVPELDPNDFSKNFETYSSLDSLGRCGSAYANLCTELLPTEERGDISAIHPSGWCQNFYTFDENKEEALYNRCHLIAHCLGGDDISENLITGTEHFNKIGMWYFEAQVQDFIYETGENVLYCVTPVFKNDNLVADGVHIQALSENNELQFNVFVYNVEDGINIDYKTGYNWEEE